VSSALVPPPLPISTTIEFPTIFFPYSELIKLPPPPEVDISKRELYLEDTEFASLFKLTKKEFVVLPKWKQIVLKKEVKLF